MIENEMNSSGKGKFRKVSCLHCGMEMTSNNKERWRQHVRTGCAHVPSTVKAKYPLPSLNNKVVSVIVDKIEQATGSGRSAINASSSTDAAAPACLGKRIASHPPVDDGNNSPNKITRFMDSISAADKAALDNLK